MCEHNSAIFLRYGEELEFVSELKYLGVYLVAKLPVTERFAATKMIKMTANGQGDSVKVDSIDDDPDT